MLQPLGPWTYRTEDRLGGGGLAQTYRCARPGDPQGYAIKVLKNPQHLNTLLREAGALIALEGHPAIPALLDHGRNAAGALCLVSTLMPGTRLDHWVRRHGPLPVEGTLSVVAQVLGILQHAHGRGLLHKDLKHSNLLIEQGRVTLLDWGASERLDEPPAETIRAKPMFVAPECQAGRHGAASDFYALGWLLVFLATGAEPFHCAQRKDRAYWGLAHVLERRELPPLAAPLRQLAGHWLHRDPARRSVAYDLQALLRTPSPHPLDDSGLDFSAIALQEDMLAFGARHRIPGYQCEQAKKLAEAGRTAEAIALLEDASAQGHLRATRMLGDWLQEDPPQHDRALGLLRQAANAGSIPASYLLAKALLRAGEPCTPGSTPHALLAYAARQGHASALERLARYLPPLPARLARERAAESGHPRALRLLGR
jgi:serine/threonine protein kinase